MFPESVQLFLYLAVTAAGVGLWSMYSSSRLRKRKRLVGHVTGLTAYPLKSCRGVDALEAECKRCGLRLLRPEDTAESDVRDRHWMVTTKDYKMMTLREHYRLALISVSLHGDYMHLDAPNIETCKILIYDSSRPEISAQIWTHELLAVDCGEEASNWLSRHFGEDGVRLVHHLNRHPNKVRDKYVSKLEPENAVAFIDAAPYMLISEESLTDANSHLPYPISMLTLRPNIIISGCPPYAEETWMDVVIGEKATFTFMKPCTRCPVTLVDVDKGERYPDGEPMKTLRTFRPCIKENNYSPVMGNKYKIVTPGAIKVGDPVYALE